MTVMASVGGSLHAVVCTTGRMAVLSSSVADDAHDVHDEGDDGDMRRIEPVEEPFHRSAALPVVRQHERQRPYHHPFVTAGERHP